MKLFYNNIPLKESPLAEELFATPDFALEIFNKLKEHQNCKLLRLSFLKNNTPSYFYGVESNGSFYYPNGEITLSYLDRYFNLFYTFDKLEINEIEPYSINRNIRLSNISREILSDFFILKKDVFVKDKFNEEYNLKIIENSDLSIGDNVYVDEISLFKNNQKIAYLKAKYCPEKFFYLYPEFQDDYFLNKATIDYSRVHDDYKNKGLGYLLYFYTAQHFNEKNISFRQSTMCSESAKLLWSKLDEHLNEFISSGLIGKKDKTLVKFLSIPKNNTLVFENNKPKIKKSI